jgi:hypothetical protein
MKASQFSDAQKAFTGESMPEAAGFGDARCRQWKNIATAALNACAILRRQQATRS